MRKLSACGVKRHFYRAARLWKCRLPPSFLHLFIDQGCDDLSVSKAQNLCSCFTPAHLVLMMVTFFYVFINIMRPEYKPFSIAFIIALFIFYTWKRILTILVTAVIAFALITFLPFLAPVAFIIMIIIFLARLGYIIDNWRPVLAGFYMYGMAAFFGMQWYIDIPYRYFHRYFFSINPLYAAAIAFIVTLGFHLILLWLYHHHYTLKRAMPIMGVAPLLIILLLMPFIKAIDGFDGGVDSTDTLDTDNSVDTVDTPADVYDITHPDYVDTPGHDVSDAPGVHYTHDYFRTGPDGSLQHVNGYEATNPDGIVENNFSYHGHAADGVVPDAAPAEGISAETADHAMDSLDAAVDKKPSFLHAREDNKRKKPVTVKELPNKYGHVK